MKTENNLQNKAAFVSQYIGQEVFCFDGINKARKLEGKRLDFLNEDDCIELYSLEDITDEHAIELFEIEGKVNLASVKYEDRGFWIAWTVEASTPSYVYLNDLTGKQVDYLRSKGYLIGFRDLTAEDLLSYGWAKIKKRAIKKELDK